MAKTREQRKQRERAKTALMVLAAIILWGYVCTTMVKAWVNEPVLTGVEYLESIQVYGDSNDR